MLAQVVECVGWCREDLSSNLECAISVNFIYLISFACMIGRGV